MRNARIARALPNPQAFIMPKWQIETSNLIGSTISKPLQIEPGRPDRQALRSILHEPSSKIVPNAIGSFTAHFSGKVSSATKMSGTVTGTTDKPNEKWSAEKKK